MRRYLIKPLKAKLVIYFSGMVCALFGGFCLPHLADDMWEQTGIGAACLIAFIAFAIPAESVLRKFERKNDF